MRASSVSISVCPKPLRAVTAPPAVQLMEERPQHHRHLMQQRCSFGSSPEVSFSSDINFPNIKVKVKLQIIYTMFTCKKVPSLIKLVLLPQQCDFLHYAVVVSVKNTV